MLELLDLRDRRERLEPRGLEIDPSVADAVRGIIERVRAEGDEALFDLTLKFDGADLRQTGLTVSPQEFQRAEETVPSELKAALDQGGPVTIAILDYGMGNLRSVARAIERVGGVPEVVDGAGSALAADALVVPGVGCISARACGISWIAGSTAASGTSWRPDGRCSAFAWDADTVQTKRGGPAGGPGDRSRPGQEVAPMVKVPHMGWNTMDRVSVHPYVRNLPAVPASTSSTPMRPTSWPA